MKRREFLVLLGGAGVAWPLVARAQQGERMRHIGVLMYYSESDWEAQIRAKALEEELEKLGWTRERNLRIDYRWGQPLPTLAADLVRLRVDAIIAVSTPAVMAVQRETRTIPIVFTQVSDPVGQGIIENMAQPGGNVTGFTNYDPAIGGKWPLRDPFGSRDMFGRVTWPTIDLAQGPEDHVR
jgi:putative ABC transport system substrate-binding protein